MNIFKKILVPTLNTSLLVLALWATHTQAQLGCTNENTAVPATTPTADFTLHGDGTATHKTTGLMWMRCSLGQTWNGSDCTDSATLFAWAGVSAVAVGSNFAGYSDWRLPNRNELGSIVERRCYNPSINPVVFPNTQYLNAFWSSSPDARNNGGSWATNFSLGGSIPYSKLSYGHVRLVRSGN